MNWQHVARRNGQTLTRSTRPSEVSLNGFCTRIQQRLQPPVDRWQRAQSLIKTPSVRRASVQETQTPQLWAGAVRRSHGGRGKNAPEPSRPKHVELVLSPELLSTMTTAADAVLRQSILQSNSEVNDRIIGGKDFQARQNSSGTSLYRCALLKERFQYNQVNRRMENIRTIRQSLPMNQYRDDVLKLVNENLFSIIVGATGSGKSTQVPQIIFDDAIERSVGSTINIVCSQPRRMAATSIAQRVAAERNEQLGDTVGYYVRFDHKLAESRGVINYCTIGAMLQKLHKDPKYLDDLSHIILDEVHERSAEIDMAMAVLKRYIEQRLRDGCHVPRIVVMSATLDEPLFRNYFGQINASGQKIPCPILRVPGRTFPVTKVFLDDLLSQLKLNFTPKELRGLTEDKISGEFVIRERAFKVTNTLSNASADAPIPTALIAATVAHIVKSSTTNGAILVFLPGWREIMGVKHALEEYPLEVDFNQQSKFKIYTVHSEFLESQADLFSSEAKGIRKIILATNIAETSITIPEVEYVVDSGKHRQDSYDQENGTSELKSRWISKSSSDQRAGRAGRVQSGKYFAIFSENRYHTLGQATPAILRTDLQGVCLNAKFWMPEIPIKDFLFGLIAPPNSDIVDTAIESLRDIDALNSGDEITPLGAVLSALPIHPYIGRMLILGIVFRCLDPMLMIAASTSTNKLFVRPVGQETEANAAHRAFDKGYNSDHIRLVMAFRAARDQKFFSRWDYEEFMRKNFLSSRSFDAIQRIMMQITRILENAGLVPSSAAKRDVNLNENSGNFALIRALSIATHRGNIARLLDPNDKEGFFQTKGKRALALRSSANNPFRRADKELGTLDFPHDAILSYADMGRTDEGDYTLRDTTLVSPVAAALFASELQINSKGTLLTLNKWLKLKIQWSPDLPAEEDISTIILLFREAWDQILQSAFSRLLHGQNPLQGAHQQAFVDALVKVVSRDLGDEDMRRILYGLEVDEKREAKKAEKKRQTDLRLAAEAARIVRLKGHVEKAYRTTEIS